MKNIYPWSLKDPIDTFFFDCDGTLSLIEGINVLATMNGVLEKVREITERCMGKTGMTPEDYRQRLDYIKPTLKQIEELAQNYKQHIAPGAVELIQLLHYLKKKVYIISAGIKFAVDSFAQTLGVPTSRVLAVNVYLNQDGVYQGFDGQSNMTKAQGKAIEISSILKEDESSLLVGDGVTDWEAQDTVTRFIGFAGLNPKLWVKNHSKFYITSTSFYPIIPLGLTQSEVKQLPAHYYAYYQKGLTDFQDSVLFKEG